MSCRGVETCDSWGVIGLVMILIVICLSVGDAITETKRSADRVIEACTGVAPTDTMKEGE